MSPDPRERDLVKCEDMRLYAERAIQYAGPLSLTEFMANDLVQAAVVRCVEVIGEAARLVSDGARRRCLSIPWPLIVGTRNIVAHNYGAVDLDRVYRIVKEDLPNLIKNLDPLIKELERETHWTDSPPSTPGTPLDRS